MEYQKKLILFLDLLGFKSFINEKTQLDDNYVMHIQSIINLIETIRDDFCLDASINPNQRLRSNLFSNSRITQFSDSIIMSSFYLVEDHLKETLVDIVAMQCNAIYSGFLFRGALTYGDILHTDKYLFGPGFIDAYEMERDKAVYPRIIISDSVINNVNSTCKACDDLIVTDKDGIKYLDIFSGFKYRFNRESSIRVMISALERIILEGKKNQNKNILEKYLWLEEELLKYKKREKRHITNASTL